MSLSSATVRLGLSARIGHSRSIGRREIFLWIALALLANEIFQVVDIQSHLRSAQALRLKIAFCG